jgi:hypothetical protein
MKLENLFRYKVFKMLVRGKKPLPDRGNVQLCLKTERV